MNQESLENRGQVFNLEEVQKPRENPLQGVRLLPVLSLLMVLLAGVCLMLGHYEVWINIVF